MPFVQSNLRVERLHAEARYHAAFNYWNLRGILAEKWGHGPIFGARSLGPEHVALTPPHDESDRRLQVVYGLNATGLLAEGERWVPQARELADQWFRDSHDVLKPKRTVRASVQLFALYPLHDAVQTSRRLRGSFYRHDALEATLPGRLSDERDTFHAAIDWFIPFEGGTVSLIAGAVGPAHRGVFWAWDDEDRDRSWWFGFNYNATVTNEDGIPEPAKAIERLLSDAFVDIEEAAAAVLQPLVS